MSATIRVSILFFYRRIFAKGSLYNEWLISGLLALQAAYLITFSIVPGFMCPPLSGAWDVENRLRYCSVAYYQYMTQALYIVSMAFDIILLVFPIFQVARLKMPMGRRIGIAVIFGFG